MAVKKVKKDTARASKSQQAPVENSDQVSEVNEEEEPDVADLESSEICQNNRTTCINSNIDGVLEVFDETTCRDLLIGYYEVASRSYSRC